MIDLHTHTCCSDGADSVEALLRRAEEMKLSVLSITDHNTVAAYRGRGISEYSGTLIPGVEITCMYRARWWRSWATATGWRTWRSNFPAMC
ncbi:PHP domain-containing protein [Enterocloster lavalensis]|uniref:PHP domain-containing protein n=1 Tax=Enterocloster lavalensis TaxID=460384 RepID=UPI002A7F3CB0|nr:PHP domain-containing protein [Enterocloster lavalensis]